MPERRYETLAPATCEPLHTCRFTRSAVAFDAGFGTVVMYVGGHASRRADNRIARHGEGSALSVGRMTDALSIRWPPVRTMRIEGGSKFGFPRLLGIISALLRDGVGEVEVLEDDGSITVYSKD